MNRILKVLTGIAVSAGMLFAANAANAEELKTVKIGITPYFDYMPWVLAKDMGLDQQLGLNFELVTVATTPQGVAAMRQGSVDVVSSCHVCDFPLYKSVPSLRSWLITDQFKGFIIIGRTGTETYESVVAGSDPQLAKEKILKGFSGKTFALMPASFRPLLSSALSQVGMKYEDVKILEFGDDAAAALAFQRGEGDYYMGSLTQEIKLLARPDKYVNVGGQEILGPAGLWYSTMVSSQEWLNANEDTVLKMSAIWSRLARYMNEKYDETAPKLIAVNNERAAASFTPEDFKIMFGLLTFPTLDVAGKTVFNPESDLYWKRSVSFYEQKNASDLPAGVKADDKALEEVYFQKLKANAKLVEWINAPL
ncbi:ABC-type nitrate/sulfonate/bicarbonate transport system substrate-binding protein [Rhizobium sp. BK529]|uniref:ABC transporter substrate-binding protein n=1 Tax=Rhizobium sp. BK529 TaxID=2586983 RepID=UPI00161AF464|nr:ABC transporter substrate-binding protein [Rhizobium sp. BK529]MBB3594914.1 ABC-type nitrate/sulfonate/bicarbonate transport system substrate-binding protein [Rhizobium sp. BK529]